MTMPYIRRSCLFAMTLAVLPCSVHAEPKVPESIKETIRERVSKGVAPSVVVGIIDESGQTYFSHGYVSVDNKTPVNEDSIYEIASITKVFTSTILADLEIQGALTLNDPLETHLPDDVTVPSRNGKKITLWSLATHRSGLPRMPSNYQDTDSNNRHVDCTVREVYEFLSDHKLARDVGEKVEYSNLGFGLLGHALTHVTGKSYEAMVHDHICNPLRMDSTTITLSPALKTRLARGHYDNKIVDNWDIIGMAGAGALRSSARDMLRFLEANLGLFEPRIYPAMQRAQQRGLGWGFRPPEVKIFSHNGGTGGYRCYCGFDTGKKVGVVILTNAGGEAMGVDDLGLQILESHPGSMEDRKKAALHKRRLLERLREGEPIRINCGGEELTTADGRRWYADLFFTRGFTPRKNDVDIQDTEYDRIYWSERSFTEQPESGEYRIPLPSGRYRVVLHFAELFFKEPGRRRFHVALEGENVLTEYEPKINKAEVFEFETRVDDGRLDVALIHGSLDNPKISAIEIEPLTADSSDAPKAAALHSPEGWSAEDGSYPPAWAPSLKWTGELKLRFSPGMFRENDPEFWSYVILYSLDGDVMQETKELIHALRVYDAGLYRKKWPVEKIDIRVDKHWQTRRSGNDVSRWAITYDGFDPFVTNKPLTTKMEIWRSYSPKQDRTGVLILRSPRSPSSGGSTWRALRTFEKDFSAQFVLPKENRPRNGAPSGSRSGGKK